MADALWVSIPTTETLTHERLCALADAAGLEYDFQEARTLAGLVEIEEIHFEVLDEKAAEFWRARGAIWGSPEYPNFIPIADAIDAARYAILTEETDV